MTPRRFTIDLLRSNYKARIRALFSDFKAGWKRCPDWIDKSYGQVAADFPEVLLWEVERANSGRVTTYIEEIQL